MYSWVNKHLFIVVIFILLHINKHYKKLIVCTHIQVLDTLLWVLRQGCQLNLLKFYLLPFFGKMNFSVPLILKTKKLKSPTKQIANAHDSSQISLSCSAVKHRVTHCTWEKLLSWHRPNINYIGFLTTICKVCTFCKARHHTCKDQASKNWKKHRKLMTVEHASTSHQILVV